MIVPLYIYNNMDQYKQTKNTELKNIPKPEPTKYTEKNYLNLYLN